MNNLPSLAIYLYGVGRVAANLGYKTRALSALDESILIARRRKLDDLFSDGALLAGRVYLDVGEIETASRRMGEALEGAKRAGDSARIRSALSGFGQLYLTVGSAQRARDYFSTAGAMPIMAAEGVEGVVGRGGDDAVELGKARVMELMGRESEAVASYRALISGGSEPEERNKSNRALALCRLGRILRERSLVRDGGLKLALSIGDRSVEAECLVALGDMDVVSGASDSAMRNFEQALKIDRALGTPWGEMEILRKESLLAVGRGREEEAENLIRQAVDVGQRLGDGIDRFDLRLIVSEWLSDYYLVLLSQLTRVDGAETTPADLAAAFEASDRLHGWALGRTTEEALRARKESAGTLVWERQRDVVAQLSAVARREGGLQSALGGASASAARVDLYGLLDQFWEAEADERRGVSRVRVVSGRERRAVVCSNGITVLEFTLAAPSSFLFVLSCDGLDFFRLPAREVIERAAQEFLDKVRSPLARDEAVESVYNRQLSQLLLGQVAGKLKSRRLLILADGLLLDVPFGPLLDPDSLNYKNGISVRLIAKHEIEMGVSVSSLERLRRTDVQENWCKKSISVVADPVFSGDDPRLRGKKSASGLEPGGPSTRRLIGTSREGDEIGRLPWCGNNTRFMGFDANRSLVLSHVMPKGGIIHFATGFRPDRDIWETSRLNLSAIDSAGGLINGDLFAFEVFFARVPADLVVLSTGSSGLGRLGRGVGSMGLAQSFIRSGARRVLDTVWNVDDRATADLMAHFYRHLLRDGAGPAAALRDAQLEMASSARYRSPYYWGGFRVESVE